MDVTDSILYCWHSQKKKKIAKVMDLLVETKSTKNWLGQLGHGLTKLSYIAAVLESHIPVLMWSLKEV